MADDPPWADILDFWFGETSADGGFEQSRMELWFGKSAEVDAECRERFLPRIEAASREELSWAHEPHGRLALVILIDQLRRNVFRGSAQMYAADAVARRHTLAAVDSGEHERLDPVQRLFLYLPLEHSEELADQERVVSLCQALEAVVDPAHRETYEGFTKYAVQHRDIIARFGRFPHRNEILGRESTAEELEFLKQPGSSF